MSCDYKHSRFHATETRQRAIDLYQSGMTAPQVAKELKMGTATVYAIVRPLGLVRPRGLPNEVKQQIVDAYNAGQSPAAIARNLSLAATTVTDHIDATGITRASILRPQRDQTIASEYLDGLSVGRLGEKYGLHETTVLHILNRDNIPIRPQKRLSATTKQAILADYEAGLTTGIIASRYAICTTAVSKVVRSLGGKLRGRSIANEIKEKAVTAYLQGETSTAVESLFGISGPTLFKALKAAGHTSRSQRIYDKLPLDSLLTDYRNGLTCKELADKYSTQPHLIRTALQPTGVFSEPENEKQIAAKRTRYKVHARKSRGALSHRWKGGVTALRQIIRTCAAYKEWRLSVFKRDNFTCQHCGGNNKKHRVVLEVDHKYPFSLIISDYCIKTLDEALACADLWDIDNGQTLCRSCHKQTPTYGTKALMYQLPVCGS